MSKVPPNASTMPAASSCPAATRIAARKAIDVPTTVIWFGVTGSDARRDMKRSAFRRTQASNRVVNMHHLKLRDAGASLLARLPVDLQHLLGHGAPRISLRLRVPEGAHALAQLLVPCKDDERGAELGPALRLDGEAVLPRFDDRHVARHLGGYDGQARGHRLEEHDAEALAPGRGCAEDVRRRVVAREHAVRNEARHHDVGEAVSRDERLRAAAQRTVSDDDQP